VPGLHGGADAGSTHPVTPAVTTWDALRWARVLDRIEYRQAAIGLRFWGPPLWLEVTMVGPDSGDWATAGLSAPAERSWDWQSTDPCSEAMALAGEGAGDGALLEAAGRYAFFNLVLNATHEIGEWFRFDAARVFPAHGTGGSDDGVQGNGAVGVDVAFLDDAAVGSTPLPAPPSIAVRALEVAATWRFTYLPGTVISFTSDGPKVSGADGPESERCLPWTAARRAITGDDDEFRLAVIRDVHAALVAWEAQRVCDAFFVDGERPRRRVEGLWPGASGPGLVAVDVSYG
jgi:hypothetical protein